MEIPLITENQVEISGIFQDSLDECSLGELVELASEVNKRLTERLVDPNARHELAEYGHSESAQDWGTSFKEEKPDPKQPPAPPEKEHEALPRIMKTVARLRNRMAAIETLSARLLDDVFAIESDRTRLLGIPEGVKGFKDSAEYVRKYWNIQGTEAKKILKRANFHVPSPSRKPDQEDVRVLPEFSKAFLDGGITPVNADRIVKVHEDLTTYALRTNSGTHGIPGFFKTSDSHFTAAGADESPWMFTRTCSDATQRAADLINQDGPPPAEVLGRKLSEQLVVKDLGNGWREFRIVSGPGASEVISTFIEPATSRHYGKYSDQTLADALQSIADARAAASEDVQDSVKDDNERPEEAQITEEPVEREVSDAVGEEVGVEEAPMFDKASEDTDDEEYREAVVAQTADGKDVHGKEILRTVDKRTRPQRRFDALLNIVFRVLSMSNSSSILPKVRSHPVRVGVTIDANTLARVIDKRNERIRFERGVSREESAFQPDLGLSDNEIFEQYQCTGELEGALHPRESEWLLCGAEFIGTLVDGEGRILNQGREVRLFDHHQVMALKTRSGGCAIPGCSVPAIDCQAHHLDEFASGGCTDINRAELVCARHHRMLHEGAWKVVEVGDQRYFQPAPWLDPEQKLMRNTYWERIRKTPPKAA